VWRCDWCGGDWCGGDWCGGDWCGGDFGVIVNDQDIVNMRGVEDDMFALFND
jgi:hypothetical protein